MATSMQLFYVVTIALLLECGSLEAAAPGGNTPDNAAMAIADATNPMESPPLAQMEAPAEAVTPAEETQTKQASRLEDAQEGAKEKAEAEAEEAPQSQDDDDQVQIAT